MSAGRRPRARWAALVATSIALSSVAAPGRAQTPTACDDQTAPETAGPTAVAAVTGNGGLTAALDGAGTVTVLKWPNASFYDQIKYRTTERGEPRMGALPNEGAFVGIAWRRAGAEKWTFEWLRNLRSAQRYSDDDGDEIVTVFRAGRAGLKVTLRDLVPVHDDVLVRSVTVARERDSDAAKVRVFGFANFNPVFSKDRNSPNQDWCNEDENDAGARYVRRADAIFHSRAGTDASTGEASSVALALGLGKPSQAHQVGVDTFETGGQGRSAYDDAKDGKLSNSNSASGQADAAMAAELAFRRRDVVSTQVYLAAGSDEERALRALEAARATSVAAYGREKATWWRNWLDDAVLPRRAPRAVTELSKRALITIRQNTAGDLVMASVATQNPQGLDWIRNGAYINRALHLGGHPEVVEDHNLRYADLQATSAFKPPGGETTPSGNWSQNYYADGVVGGPISYEVDETGLGIWTLWDHYAQTNDRDYLFDVYEAIQRAAHYLSDNPPLGCRDPSTGLQCLASEGDDPSPSQTIVGAQAAWLGLDAAVKAAREIGSDTSLANAQKWLDRRDELGAAISSSLLNDGCNCYSTDHEVGGTNLWPVGLEPYGSAISRAQADANWRHVKRALRGDAVAGGHEAKAVLGNAYEWAGRGAKVRDLERALKWIATRTTTEGTGSLGEAWRHFPKRGSPIVAQVSQPHAWAQAIFYLAAVKTYGGAAWTP